MLDKIIFAIEGSFVDLITGEVPNYDRLSSMWIESGTEDISLNILEAHHPAFFGEKKTIYLEPGSVNEIPENNSISSSEWVKGEYVFYREAEDYSPEKNLSATLIIFTGDSGESPEKQTITRTFLIEPSTDYTLSGLFKLKNGTFGKNDQIRVLGGVRNSSSINLEQLNSYPDQYRFLETSFTTQGISETEFDLQDINWEVIATDVIITTRFKVTLLSNSLINWAVEPNELIDSKLAISGKDFCTIIDNTAYVAETGVLEITVDLTDFPISLIPSSGDTGVIFSPDLQSVTIEIYCESNVSLVWGMLQLQPLPFRTSPIIQSAQIQSLSTTEVVYPRSPIRGLDDFAVFWQVEFWRGKVNLYQSENFGVEVEKEKIIINWDGGVHEYQGHIPQSFSLLVQLWKNKQELRVYLDGVLVFKTVLGSVNNAEWDSRLTLTNELGVLGLNQLIVYRYHLQDGDIAVLEPAQEEVGELFAEDPIKPLKVLNRHFTINLPRLKIPGAQTEERYLIAEVIPHEKKIVLADYEAGRTVIEDNGVFEYFSTFYERQYVKIVRDVYGDSITEEDAIISHTVVTSSYPNSNTPPSPNNGWIRLESIQGVVPGDYIVKGYLKPGRASIRFPFIPIDSQKITSGDEFFNTFEIPVASAANFKLGKAFIYENPYQDITETLIVAIDNVSNIITLSSQTYIFGNKTYFIAQPKFETLISPQNYLAEIKEATENIRIKQKTLNAVVFENFNPGELEVTPYLKVFL